MNSDSAKIELRSTSVSGAGVFAKDFMFKDEHVAFWDGNFYDYDSSKWNDDIRDHAVNVGPRTWRDSHGLARMLNHSCDPNVGWGLKYQLVTMRDVEPGEELVWDYEMSETDHENFTMACSCGSSACRKVISSHFNMPEEVKRRYGNYIAEWLRSNL